MICRASTLPSVTEWLARETSGDEFGTDVPHAANVPVVRYIRPVAFEDCARERVDFGEADCGVAHCLGCEGKSADAGEQVKMGLLF